MWQSPNQRLRAIANAKKRARERARIPLHYKRINGRIRLYHEPEASPLEASRGGSSKFDQEEVEPTLTKAQETAQEAPKPGEQQPQEVKTQTAEPIASDQKQDDPAQAKPANGESPVTVSNQAAPEGSNESPAIGKEAKTETETGTAKQSSPQMESQSETLPSVKTDQTESETRTEAKDAREASLHEAHLENEVQEPTIDVRIVINDFNSNGVGIFSPENFSPQDHVILELNEPMKLIVKARVVYSQEINANSRVLSAQHYSHRIGLEFIPDTDMKEIEIQEYVDALRTNYLGKSIA